MRFEIEGTVLKKAIPENPEDYSKPIQIPPGVTEIGSNAFFPLGNASYYYPDEKQKNFTVCCITFEDGEATEARQYDIEVLINAIDLNALDPILFNCYRNNQPALCVDNMLRLGRIIFPESLTKINEDAFNGCYIENLDFTAVTGNLTIEKNTFCFTKLNKIKFSETMQQLIIGTSAFSPGKMKIYEKYDNTATLKKVIFPQTIKRLIIEDNAFSNNQNAEFLFPHTVKEALIIKSHSFDGCAIIGTLELPERTLSVGAYAFGNCMYLKKIILPKSLYDAQTNRSAFEKKLNLELPEISPDAFQGLHPENSGIQWNLSWNEKKSAWNYLYVPSTYFKDAETMLIQKDYHKTESDTQKYTVALSILLYITDAKETKDFIAEEFFNILRWLFKERPKGHYLYIMKILSCERIMYQAIQKSNPACRKNVNAAFALYKTLPEWKANSLTLLIEAASCKRLHYACMSSLLAFFTKTTNLEDEFRYGLEYMERHLPENEKRVTSIIKNLVKFEHKKPEYTPILLEYAEKHNLDLKPKLEL